MSAAPMLYKVVTSSDPKGLEVAVQDMLNRGWIPLGGLSVSQMQTVDGAGDYDESVLWGQAIYRNPTIPEK